MNYNRVAFVSSIIVLSVLLAFTILTLMFNLDIIFQNYFYNANEGWIFEKNAVYNFLYKFGIIPGFLLGLSSLVLLALSYYKIKYINYRRIAFALLFTFALAPALIINLGLKENFGRPRPREVKELGGKHNFHPILKPGFETNGKSFPCGHCSMAFILSVPFLFFFHRNKKLAITFLISGLVLGVAMSLARMSAGGHFFSDALWSGAIVWMVAITAYFLFKPYLLISPDQVKISEKVAKRSKTFIIISVPLAVLILLLATPYISKKEVTLLQNDFDSLKIAQIRVQVPKADLRISKRDLFAVNYKVNGFGFPGSKIRLSWQKDTLTVLKLEKLGWFTELGIDMNVFIPDSSLANVSVELTKGTILLDIDESSLFSILKLKLDNGTVQIYNASKKTFVIKGVSLWHFNQSANLEQIDETMVKVNKGIATDTLRFNTFNGSIELIN